MPILRSPVRFAVLGPVRAWRGEHELSLGSPQSRTLLALLLAHGGEVVSLARLVDAMWGGEPPHTAVNAVHRNVGLLRRMIEPGLSTRDTGGWLLPSGGGYRLVLEPDDLDLLRFRRLVERAREDPGTASYSYRQALDLWSGSVADGIDPMARGDAVFTGLDQELSAVAREAADVALAAGHAELLRGPVRLAAERAPFDEQLHARVVTVAGMAGVGKTSLAVHWAHRAADRFPDGRLYLDLYGFDRDRSPLTPPEALSTLLQGLGVPRDDLPGSLDARTALYRTLLAGRRVLILLDNARDGTQIHPLIAGGTGSLVIVTGRIASLGLTALHGAPVLRLHPLTPLGSRRLLQKRLGPARLTAEPEATSEIIAYCGGLPLALAIVAAHAQHDPDLPLRALADGLRGPGRLDLLSAPDLPNDVRTSFALSLSALTSHAVTLFTRLGRAEADSGLAAAAGLLGASPRHTRSVLAELTASGLLSEPNPGRYRMHELPRLYARELLAHSLPTESDLASVTSINSD